MIRSLSRYLQGKSLMRQPHVERGQSGNGSYLQFLDDVGKDVAYSRPQQRPNPNNNNKATAAKNKQHYHSDDNVAPSIVSRHWFVFGHS